MAVSVTRMWSPDSADRDPDNQGASATWQVTGVASSIAAQTAVDATTSETPDQLNSVYQDRDGVSYSYLLCDSVSVSTSGFEVFEVTATYSRPSDGGSHNPEPDNPLDRPVEYSWEIGTALQTIETDINGNAIVNAAGDPPEQPVQIEVTSVFLNCMRNEASFNAATAISFTNRVNADSFFGASSGQAKCVGIRSDKMTTPDSVYWPVHYRFEFRGGVINGVADAKFRKRIINRGYNMIKDGKLTRIVDGDEPGSLVEDAVRLSRPSVSRPRLLDANGGLLGANAQPIVLEFDVYESINFGQFNLE